MSKTMSNYSNFTAGEAYTGGRDHLQDELKWLDLRLQLLLTGRRPQREESPLEQLRGLVMSEKEAERLLAASPAGNRGDPAAAGLSERLRRLEDTLRSRRSLSSAAGIVLPLAYLAEAFELTPFEEKCVVVCLAVEMDHKYAKLYAFLQDDLTCKRPTVDLVMNLLCDTPAERLEARHYFNPLGILNRYFFNKDDRPAPGQSLLARELKLDERVIDFLLDSGETDAVIGVFTRIVYPDGELPALILDQDISEKISNYVNSGYAGGDRKNRSTVFNLYGPGGSGKKLQVMHCCQHFNQTLLIVDLGLAISAPRPFGELMERVGREAVLQRAVICYDNFQVLLDEDPASRNRLRELFDAVKIFAGIFFLLAERHWKPDGYIMREHIFIGIEFNIPPDFQRKRIWEHLAGGYEFAGPVDWGAMAAKFRFTPGQIQNALITAENMTGWNTPAPGFIGSSDLYRACYVQAHHKLEHKATRVKPKYTWPDVILPAAQKEQLKNACNQMKFRHIVYGEWGFERKLPYGKGLSMLFSGPPGTGKTMSAQVVAGELQLELYKINLAQMVSKYIGETEKNLQQVFQEAQQSNAILFFDETDALFGKRSEVKDSHDRYANIETAYLLQKMEEYEGVTILATNLIQNIDDAFMRRINFVIEFPSPDAVSREKIWRSIFPGEAPLAEGIDYEFIARKFEVSGGNIKNIAVSAAFLAAEEAEPISMKHIIRAASYELQKTGKILLKNELGEYDRLI